MAAPRAGGGDYERALAEVMNVFALQQTTWIDKRNVNDIPERIEQTIDEAIARLTDIIDTSRQEPSLLGYFAAL